MFEKLRKIGSILDTETRRKLFGLLVLLALGAILEMVGIGAFIPLLQTMVDPAAAMKNPVIASVRDVLPEMTESTWVILSCAVLIGLIVVRNFALLGIIFIQNRTIYRVQAKYVERLFAFYLHQPFLFHVKSNSADLIRNVHSSIQYVFTGAILSTLNLVLETLIGLSVCLVLFLVEPVATALLFLLLGAGGAIIYLSTREYARAWGALSHHFEALILRALNQGFNAVNEAKVLGRESFFTRILANHVSQRGRYDSAHATLTQMPRLALEILAAVGFAAVVVVILASSGSAEAQIPTLGVYAVAAFRIMPSLNRALGHATLVRRTAAAIDTVHADLSQIPRDALNPGAGPAVIPVPFEIGIELRDVSFLYPGRETVAVRNVNLRVPRGAIIGFVGPSGSGKTTLAALMLGLIDPSEGTIAVDGTDIAGNIRGWQERLGYVPQTVFVADDTLRRNIAFGLPDDVIDDTRVARVLALANLTRVVEALPEGLDTVIGENGAQLSGGQRQRLGIARALYRDPAMLLLDEATSSLDTETEWEISNAIHSLQGEKTIILIAHRLSTIKHCDTVFFMKEGAVVDSGTFDDLAARNPDFKRLVNLARVDSHGRLDDTGPESPAMRESDIRPPDLFGPYLRLCVEDTRQFFSDTGTFESRACPGCGEESFIPGFDKQGFAYGRCARCGTLYANPVPSHEALARFYAEAPSQRYWANTFFPPVAEARRTMIVRPRIDAIRTLYAEHGVNMVAERVVDVGAGAGTGIFLAECQAAGFGRSHGAVEPTPELWDTCANAGFDVFRGPSDDAVGDVAWCDAADVVTAFEVIEHTLSPVTFLENLGRLARPGGLIIVTGVCGTGFDILTLGKRSNAVNPPRHLTFLSEAGAAKAAERAGLSMVCFKTPGKLDVDIVRSAMQRDPATVVDPFLGHLLARPDSETLEGFQAFLAGHRLSSHMWLVLRRN